MNELSPPDASAASAPITSPRAAEGPEPAKTETPAEPLARSRTRRAVKPLEPLPELAARTEAPPQLASASRFGAGSLRAAARLGG